MQLLNKPHIWSAWACFNLTAFKHISLNQLWSYRGWDSGILKTDVAYQFVCKFNTVTFHISVYTQNIKVLFRVTFIFAILSKG